MRNANQQSVDKKPHNLMKYSSRNILLMACLVTGVVFFGVAGLNVMAKSYDSEVKNAVDSCGLLLEQYKTLSLNQDQDTSLTCEAEKPYIYNLALDKVNNNIQQIQTKINIIQDDLRNQRRVLIDEQKLLINELEAYGIASDLQLPSRDQELIDQVSFLKERGELLKNQNNAAELDFQTQLNTYKYFLYLENQTDVLGIEALNNAKLDVRTQYTLIKEQNQTWAQSSKFYENNNYLRDYSILSPQEFVEIADNTQWQKPLTTNYYPIITGIESIDTLIIDHALDRGYLARGFVDEATVAPVGDESLSQAVIPSWLQMVDAAKEDGVNLTLTSGYRSEKEQKNLFVGRLRSEAFSTIGRNLVADDANTEIGLQIIDKTLSLTAPPGYSKHHTGHAVDIGNVFGINEKPTLFEDSASFSWLSKNNYYNAKRFGFVPSYPQNTPKIGPEPEAWEYVWVGTLKVD